MKIAIIGASGAVGEELLNVLAELNFPVSSILPLASARSVGIELKFKNKSYKIEELNEKSFEQNPVDIAFFSAGSKISEQYAPLAVKSGALVIDNTSFFRMCDDVPLVVPEVNPQDIKLCKRGIIANPNCSTIQMTHILKPLDDIFDLQRVDVATYQAASGAGKKGMEELVKGLQSFFSFKLSEFKAQVFPHTLALNLIPQIDVFDEEKAYTKEELKMINESQKILHKNFEISATCVRVGVLRSHSEALSLKFKKEVDLAKAIKALKNAPSVVVLDDIKKQKYPMPLELSDSNESYVGRIRKDLYDDKILHLWCVADQIRVGAATNAVRIALKWLEYQS